jgi:hypothetical protein
MSCPATREDAVIAWLDGLAVGDAPYLHGLVDAICAYRAHTNPLVQELRQLQVALYAIAFGAGILSVSPLYPALREIVDPVMQAAAEYDHADLADNLQLSYHFMAVLRAIFEHTDPPLPPATLSDSDARMAVRAATMLAPLITQARCHHD